MDNLWHIQSYARFKRDSNENNVVMKTKAPKSEWQHFSTTPQKPITIQIKEPLNLHLQAGKDILETFTLLNSSNWLKVVSRDDMLLFFYKNNNSTRRFRLKFAASATKTSKENCLSFIKQVSPYLDVDMFENSHQRLDSSQQQIHLQKPIDRGHNAHQIDSQMKSVSEITKVVLNGKIESLPPYYKDTNILFDDSKDSDLIKICLLDPNFPSFVEKVEKNLMDITKL